MRLERGSLDQAMVMATSAHAGQRRKVTEEPYIFHPIRAMLRAGRFGIEFAIVAIFHDCLEDTDMCVQDLIDAGFSPRIIEAVVLLTKDKNTNYEEEYLPRVKENLLARVVKICDIEDNMSDLETLGTFDWEKGKALRTKYETALRFLRS